MKTSAIFTIVALALTMTLNAENTYPLTSASLLNAIETVEEENIAVSSWMLNPEAFETEYAVVENRVFAIDALAETSMEIEEWMFNESLFTDYEKNIELKEWMFDVNDFLNTGTLQEEFLEIEDWMLDVESFR